MGDNIAIRLLTLSVSLYLVTCDNIMFFHELSAVTLEPGGEPNNESDFGFSMGYWNKSLIVGAPSSSLFGEVRSCDVSRKHEDATVKCSTVDIHTNETKYVSRDINPNQKFYLGASISATEKYFFTCAPLVTKTIKRDGSEKLSDAFGACYYYNGDTYHYNGPDIRYLKQGHQAQYSIANLFEGGSGWSTMADDKFLIVPKTSESADINYSNSPFDKINSFPKSLKAKLNIADDQSVGYGLAAGNFFSEKIVYYATSIKFTKLKDQIVFLKPSVKHTDLLPLMQKSHKQKFIIENEDLGANFGFALAAADLNLDSLSELLVGAPTNSEETDKTECGALYIYLGGQMKNCDQACLIDRRRVIFAEEEWGRFGSAVTSHDIDRDGYPEIFVSAPYEGDGVVYILSGDYVNSNLISSGPKQVRLSYFKDHMQRVSRSDMKWLGFSLHVIPDLDGNGCNELVIGAPASGKVLLLKCLQAVKPTISLKILGNLNVQEVDKHFVVNVHIDFDYGTNSANYSGSLIVTNEITAAPGLTKISDSESSFKVDLSNRPTNFSKDITVVLIVNEALTILKCSQNDNKLGQYTFKTILKPVNSKIQESNNFEKSWVMLRHGPDSHFKNLIVPRKCKGECKPILQVTNAWTGPNDLYLMGSSKSENVTIVVTNAVHEAYGACVLVKISGAHVAGACARLESSGFAGPCVRVDLSGARDASNWYKFDLPKPMLVNDEYNITVELDMKTLSNLDEALVVKTKLYKNCNGEEFEERVLNVSYSLENQKELVKLKGDKRNLQITDDQMLDKNIVSFQHNQEYTITNEGSITWKNVHAVIYLHNRTLFEKVNNPGNCLVENKDDEYKINCTLTLLPSLTETVIASVNLYKTEIGGSLNGGHSINLTSQLVLYLNPSDAYNLNETLVLVSEIKLKKDRSFGNNATLIITVSAVVGTLFLAIIAFALYKSNFFNRKEKKKLDLLRETVRRRSVRLASESKLSQKTASCADGDHLDIEVVEDSPFEEIPIGTNDNVVLVEAQAQVHHQPVNVRNGDSKKQ